MSSSSISDIEEDEIESSTNITINECPSIDDLLEERERESKEVSEFSEKNEDYDQPYSTFVPPFDISALGGDNMSQVEKKSFEFPFSIFEAIQNEVEEAEFPEIEPWIFLAIKNFSDSIPIDPDFYLSLANSMIVSCDEEVGHFLVKYGNKLPQKSVSFSKYLFLCHKCAETSPKMLCFILGSIEATRFIVEDFKSAVADLILLYSAMILTTEAIENPNSYYAIDKMSVAFSYGELPQECIERTGEILVAICRGEEMYEILPQISRYFPINMSGSDIMVYFGLRIILILMEESCEPFIDNLPQMLQHLKEKSIIPELCSSVVSILHKTVSAALKNGEMDQETVEQVIEMLKFTIPCHDPSLLIHLKEQMQVTRTQLDILARSHFHISSQ